VAFDVVPEFDHIAFDITHSGLLGKLWITRITL